MIFGKRKEQQPVNNNTMMHKKLSFAATEAYKLLRTNLMFTIPGDKKCRVIGITSATRGEGKSTTAINLSYVLAEAGKRTLIIDADLRLPTIAKKLDIKVEEVGKLIQETNVSSIISILIPTTPYFV